MSFLEIFDYHYLPKLGVRAHTFRAVLAEAERRGGNNSLGIVETGTVRQKNNWEGDGQSTLVLAAFAKYTGAAFTTIDLNEEASKVAREIEEEHKVPMSVITGDSVAELARRKNKIGLLYLDSFDLDTGNPGPAQAHCFMEFCAAQKLLTSGSIVFVDDSPMHNNYVVGGKGGMVDAYMRKIGVTPFACHYQTAWIMP